MNMGIIVHVDQGTLTTSSGTVSKNIIAGFNVCEQIIVKAATSSTTFSIKLTDRFGHIVYERTCETGELSEWVKLPTYGNWTFTIFNASADEDFEYLLVFNEGTG